MELLRNGCALPLLSFVETELRCVLKTVVKSATEWWSGPWPAAAAHRGGHLVRRWPGGGGSGLSGHLTAPAPGPWLPQSQPCPSPAWEWLEGTCWTHIVSMATPCFQVVSTLPDASPCPGTPGCRLGDQECLELGMSGEVPLAKASRESAFPKGERR